MNVEFSDLARSVCQPQLSEIWRSFSERQNAIVEGCASRGWHWLNGPDYAKIDKLGRSVLKEMSETIWRSLIEAYDASEIKPNEKELRRFIEDEIRQNAHSISETIIEQQNVNIQLPGIEGQKEETRSEIGAERDRLIYLLSGRLNVFVGKLCQAPLISKLTPAINTGGGPYFGGPVTAGGDIVGRDQHKVVYGQPTTIEDFTQLLAELRGLLAGARLDSDIKGAIDADFNVVEAQVQKPEPKRGLIERSSPSPGCSAVLTRRQTPRRASSRRARRSRRRSARSLHGFFRLGAARIVQRATDRFQLA